MSKQFIQMTSGWIPIAIMALLTVALIAGQASANLPNEHRTAPVAMTTTLDNVVVKTQVLQKFDSLPAVVDALLSMPMDMQLRIDTRVLRRDVSPERVSPLKSK